MCFDVISLLVRSLDSCVTVCVVGKIVQCCGNVVVNFVSFEAYDPSILDDVVIFSSKEMHNEILFHFLFRGKQCEHY